MLLYFGWTKALARPWPKLHKFRRAPSLHHGPRARVRFNLSLNLRLSHWLRLWPLLSGHRRFRKARARARARARASPCCCWRQPKLLFMVHDCCSQAQGTVTLSLTNDWDQSPPLSHRAVVASFGLSRLPVAALGCD